MKLKIYKDVEQGTDEWYKLRCGKVTASEASKLLAKGKGICRKKLLHTKVAEVMTGNPSRSYINQYMIDGAERESVIFPLYEEKTNRKIEKCGFIEKGDVGYSPDGLLGDDGLVEFKSRLDHEQVSALLKGRHPSGNTAQLQFGLWVSGRKYIDYVSQCIGLPILIERVEPDLEFHCNIEKEIELFLKERNGIIDNLTRLY